MQQLLLGTDNLARVAQGSRARSGRKGSVGFKLSTTLFKHLPSLDLPVSYSAVCTIASGEHEIRICCHSCFCISYHSYCGAEMGFFVTDLCFVCCGSQASIITQLRSNILIEIDDLVCVCVYEWVCACMHAPARLPLHCILFHHWTKHISGQCYLLADSATVYYVRYSRDMGHAVAQLVEALRY